MTTTASTLSSQLDTLADVMDPDLRERVASEGISDPVVYLVRYLDLAGWDWLDIHTGSASCREIRAAVLAKRAALANRRAAAARRRKPLAKAISLRLPPELDAEIRSSLVTGQSLAGRIADLLRAGIAAERTRR